MKTSTWGIQSCLQYAHARNIVVLTNYIHVETQITCKVIVQPQHIYGN